MFRVGPVHAQDNGPGVSDTEPERTSRYRDLLYARTGIECHRSPQGYTQGIIAHPAGRQGSRGASTPLGNAWWPPGRIQQEVVQHCWPKVTITHV